MGNAVTNRLFREFPRNSYRYLIRKGRRFNAIPRAEKKIDKFVNDKPERAPLPDVMQKSLDTELERDPDVLLKYSEKHQPLDSHLKKVYVTSEGNNRDGFSIRKVTQVQPKESAVEVPKGKYTLKAAIGFIGAHKANREEFCAQTLAHLYHMDLEKMNNILTHVKPFKVLLPTKTKSRPWYEQLKDDASPTLIVTEDVEKELLQYYHTRSTQMRQFREEKLKLPKDGGHRYLNYETKTGIPSVSVQKYVKSKLGIVEKSGSRDLPVAKPVPEDITHIEITRELTGEHDLSVSKPDDEKFDVFKEMELNDKLKKKSSDKSSDSDLKSEKML